MPCRLCRFVLLLLMASLTGGGSALAAEPELVSVEKIWDQGPHNAFTDLTRFRGKFYCVFREAKAHVGGDGKIRVLVSDEGEEWTSAALLAEKGVDLRDPKLSITPEKRLMVVCGGSVYNGTKTLMSRQPRVAFSKNGTDWTGTKRVLAEGDWLWRVSWHKGTAWGVSYRTEPPPGQKKTGDWQVTLYASEDGVDWVKVRGLDISGRPNETTLRFADDGEMIALMRREGGNHHGVIGRSRPPYTEWTWHETDYRLGGPNFIILPDGAMWAGSRYYPGGAKTVLAKMTRTSYEPVLTLPSGGDTSYPGLMWHDGLLWMSYYSSHEGKTSIYLAKIRLPE